jgi:O-antigen ligase
MALLIFLEIIVPNIDWINYKLFLAQIITGGLLFLAALDYLIKPDLRFKSCLNFPILIYLAWILASFLISPFKSSSGYSLSNNLTLVVFYFLAVSFLNNREKLDYLINLWIFTGVCVSIYAILFQENGIMASFGNPNLFASFLVSILPFSLMKFYQTEKEGRHLYLLCLFIFSAALFLTKSRAGIGAGIISLLFFSFWTMSEKKRINFKKAIPLLLIFASVTVTGILFYKEIVTFLDMKSRFYIWQGTLKMIKERLFFGWGIGNFAVFFPKFSPPQLSQIYPDQFVNNAHNEFLTITAELGILGLAIFLWFLFKIFLLAKKNLGNENYHLKITTRAALSSIIGVMVINLFDVSLRFVFTALFWWLAVAILVISDKMEGKERIEAVALGKRPHLMVRTGGALMSVFLGTVLIMRATHALWAARQYNKSFSLFRLNLNRVEEIMEEVQDKLKQGHADAQDYFRLGTLYAQRMDWDEARRFLEKAIEIDSQAIFAYNNLGNVYMNLSDIEQAINYYHKAITIAPEYLNGHYNLGFAYFKKKQVRQALRQFDFVLSKNRNDFQAWQMRQLIFE